MATKKSEIQVSLRLTGQKEFEAALKNIGKAGENLGKSFKGFSDSIAKSAKNVAIFTAAASAAASAVVGLTKTNAQTNDDLLDIAEATGVTVQKLQELIFANQTFGVSAEETTGGLLRFTNALGELQRNGAGPLQTAFEKTEPGFLNTLKNTKDVALAYQLFFEKAGQAAKSQEGFALISDVVGRKLAVASSQIAGSSKNLTTLGAEAVSAGAVLDESLLRQSELLVNTLSRLGAVVSATSRRITSAFEPALIAIAQRVTEFLENNQSKIEAFAKNFVRNVEKLFTDFVKIFRGGQIEGTVNPVVAAFARLFRELRAGFIKARREVAPVIEAIVGALDKLGKAIGVGGAGGVGIIAVFTIFSGVIGVVFNALRVGVALVPLLVAAFNAIVPTLTLVVGLFTAILSPVGLFFTALAVGVASTLGLFKDFNLVVSQAREFLGKFFADLPEKLDFTLVSFRVFVAKLKIYLSDIPATFRDIILPAINNFLAALPFQIEAAFKTLGPILVAIIQNAIAAATQFIQSATPILVQLIEAALKNLPDILTAIFNGALAVIKTLISTFGPVLLELARKAFDALPEVLSAALKKAVELSKQFLNEVAPGLIEFIKGVLGQIPILLPELAKRALLALEVLVKAAIPVLLEFVKTVFNALPGIIGAIVKVVIRTIRELVIALFPILIRLLREFSDKIPSILIGAFKIALKFLASAGIETVKAIFSGLFGSNNAAPAAPGGVTVQRRAQGGLIRGPGTGTSDSIPALVSNGEYVMKTAAVQKYGTAFMHAINAGALKLRGFAEGGLVGMSEALSVGATAPQFAGAGGASGGAGGRPLNLFLPGGVMVPATVDNETAKRLQKDLRRSDMSKSSRLPAWYK